MKNLNSQEIKTLKQLKSEILEDGIIDPAEVKEIKAILYADGIIDQEEADWLFQLNDAVSGANNDPSWGDLFSKAIGDYLLEDENSPGEIDEAETEWLYSKVQGDGQIDAVEKKLLQYLKDNAKKFPSKLETLLR